MSLVYATPEADAMIATAVGWWRDNRPRAPELLLEELRAARERLSEFPEAGVLVRRRGFSGLRRLVLRRTRYHLYYRYSPEHDEVWVVAIWAAMRRRGPRLKRP
jgi:plasmid stabilization system protein ParE